MSPEELKQKYSARIEGLLVDLREDNTTDRLTVDGCYMGTLTVIEALYGASSAQAKALAEAKKSFSKTQYSPSFELSSLRQSLLGTLLNIRAELDLGLIRSIATEAAGEVIGDLVSLAKNQLRSGYKDVAAVLASAALEDALKRKAAELGVNTEGKALDAVINALKAKSFFKGATGSIVSSYTKLRNSAMHADWDKIDQADVSSLLGFLEPFLIQNF